MEDLGAQLGSLDDDMLGLLHQFMRTCTGNARLEWERLCAANGIHFDETGSAIGSEGQTVDVPTPDMIEALERDAVDFDKIKLGRSTLGVWRDKHARIKEMEGQADAFYDFNVKSKALHKLWWEYRKREPDRRKLGRRLQGFQEWKDVMVVSICLRRWVIRHREMSLKTFQNRQAASSVVQKWRDKSAELKRKEQQAEDARDYYATSNVFTLWRQKAAELKAKRRFKNFYLMTKYGRALVVTFRARKKARLEAELTRRYRQFVREKDEKVKRKTLESWHAKAVQIREDEITADEHRDRSQDKRMKTLAHDTLTKMYDQTVDNRESREIADAHYERVLFTKLNVLGEDGKWRVQTRESKEHQTRAENYRGIKTEEKAQSAFRNMRNAAARNRQMAAMADEWRDKQDKRKALVFLGLWRQKAIEHRGGGGVHEVALPQTPAAKKSALLR